MLKNMFLPGQIENYVVIIDVNKLGVTEIPKSSLAKIIECLSKGYRYRTKRMFVLNTTFSLKFAWKVIESFMAVHMKKKMVMSDKNTVPELTTGFHPSQLEKKFGGNAPNATCFWPPIMPEGEFGYDSSLLISELEYKKLIKENLELTPRPDLFQGLDSKEISEMENNSSINMNKSSFSKLGERRMTDVPRTFEK